MRVKASTAQERIKQPNIIAMESKMKKTRLAAISGGSLLDGKNTSTSSMIEYRTRMMNAVCM